MTTNLFVRFQNLLGKEPVTRVKVISINSGNSTLSCQTSSGSVLTVSATGYQLNDFIYLRGDIVIGIAPSLTITEVII